MAYSIVIVLLLVGLYFIFKNNSKKQHALKQPLTSNWDDLLQKNVLFYKKLDPKNKLRFTFENFYPAISRYLQYKKISIEVLEKRSFIKTLLKMYSQMLPYSIMVSFNGFMN